MGCVSSKHFKKDRKQKEILFKNGGVARGDYINHVVSLTSTTYGHLKLDKELPRPIKEIVVESKKSPPREQEPEIINAWELMSDLEEEVPGSIRAKKSPKSRVFLRGFADLDVKSPLKFLNQMGSPKKLKRFGGKENKGVANYSPKTAVKASNLGDYNNLWRTAPNLRFPLKGSPKEAKCDSSRANSSRRRSLGPLFDPDLVASFEKEMSEEQEQIKKMVWTTPITQKPRNTKELDSISLVFNSFEEKCPPGGENTVVIYTTTLRGIRKTFEDCNRARSVIESHGVHFFERDVSMDSGFKEEARGLMGTTEVRVPLVFVKGRLIGGADEVVKLEEEGKLGILLDRIPRAAAICKGCGGVRFVMCSLCNGSCKLLDGQGRKTVKCDECNENGLIHCPICC